MALRAHRLDTDADAAFLAARRVDPVAALVFEPGDLVVVCAACGTPMLAETWVVLGGAHCGQTETADRLHASGGEVGPAAVPTPAEVPAAAPAVRRRSRGLVMGAVALTAVAAAVYAASSLWTPQATPRPASTAGAELLPLTRPPGWDDGAADDGLAGTGPGASAAVGIEGGMEGDLEGGMEGASASAAPGTVLVDSPGDGYLALRTEPTAERGERVTTMPHGAAVRVVGSCIHQDTIDGRSGSWCLVEYGGQQGWAFSGYLVAPAGP